MNFQTQIRVNYYDCDYNNRLKFSAAMKYMQQTSSEQLESLGFSPEKLYSENMVFLLSKVNAKIHRMPESSETLTVGTAPLLPKGPRFLREFVMDTLDGERLISSMTLWILVDPVSRKILRPASFPYPIEFQEPEIAGIIGDIPLPKGKETGPAQLRLPIRYSHIDVNGHVNNTYYGDFTCDALPDRILMEREIDTMVISFQNEARLGDVLDISTVALSDEKYFIRGLHGGSPCYEAMVGTKEKAK